MLKTNATSKPPRAGLQTPTRQASIDAIRRPATLPPMQFYQLAIGAKFFAHGQRFTKEAISMATDGHLGYVMMAETEVVPDGEPLLLPPEEAAKWKPSEVHWAEHIAPAPPERQKKVREV